MSDVFGVTYVQINETLEDISHVKSVVSSASAKLHGSLTGLPGASTIQKDMLGAERQKSLDGGDAGLFRSLSGTVEHLVPNFTLRL